MRRCLWIAGFAAAAVCHPMAAAAFSSPATAPSAPAAENRAPAGKAPVVGVDLLMRAPDKYQGTVRVRGVVSSVFPKEQRLGLLDAIYLNCCSSPCGSLQTLPVRWAGEMPAVRNLVLVTGEIRQAAGKLEFVAVSLEREKPQGGASR